MGCGDAGDAAGASPGRSGSAPAPGLSRRGSINLRESTYFYSADGLGSIRTLTNHQGIVTNTYDYTAFGEPRDSHAHPQLAINQRYTYTARESSPLAAHGAPMYYRYRSYAPTPGRFTRRDPIGYRDGVNVYGYAHSSPSRYVDQFGLFVFPIVVTPRYPTSNRPAPLSDREYFQNYLNNYLNNAQSHPIGKCFGFNVFQHKMNERLNAKGDYHVRGDIPYKYILHRAHALYSPFYGRIFYNRKDEPNFLTYGHEIVHSLDHGLGITDQSEHQMEQLAYAFEAIAKFYSDVRRMYDYMNANDCCDFRSTWNIIKAPWTHKSVDSNGNTSHEYTYSKFPLRTREGSIHKGVFEMLRDRLGLRIDFECLASAFRSHERFPKPSLECGGCHLDSSDIHPCFERSLYFAPSSSHQGQFPVPIPL